MTLCATSIQRIFLVCFRWPCQIVSSHPAELNVVILSIDLEHIDGVDYGFNDIEKSTWYINSSTYDLTGGLLDIEPLSIAPEDWKEWKAGSDPTKKPDAESFRDGSRTAWWFSDKRYNLNDIQDNGKCQPLQDVGVPSFEAKYQRHTLADAGPEVQMGIFFSPNIHPCPLTSSLDGRDISTMAQVSLPTTMPEPFRRAQRVYGFDTTGKHDPGTFWRTRAQRSASFREGTEV